MILGLVGGVYFWNVTPKEEMPNTSFDQVIITTRYDSASPENVERVVTEEVENAIKRKQVKENY